MYRDNTWAIMIILLSLIIICDIPPTSVGGRVVKAAEQESQGCEFKPPLDRDSRRRYTLKQGDH
jgi:hypothetical protein